MNAKGKSRNTAAEIKIFIQI